ncbi:hypothetical protein OJJOAM_004212 [Cupriavidus sp. H18C1]
MQGAAVANATRLHAVVPPRPHPATAASRSAIATALSADLSVDPSVALSTGLPTGLPAGVPPIAPAPASVMVVDHPLVQHKVTLVRSEDTTTDNFRRLVREIAQLLTYEATRDLAMETVAIKTPIAPMQSPMLSGKKLCLVSILRAGNGFLDGMLDLLPAARVGHIGLYRDPETLEPIEYYFKMPDDIQERQVIVVDPMLATGNSRDRRAEPAQGGRRHRAQIRLPDRLAPGFAGPAGRASRCRDRHRRDRRAAQRARLYRAGAWRCRRPALRHALTPWLPAWLRP